MLGSVHLLLVLCFLCVFDIDLSRSSLLLLWVLDACINCSYLLVPCVIIVRMSLNVLFLSSSRSHVVSVVQRIDVHDVNKSIYSIAMSLSIYFTLSEGGSLFHTTSNRITNA